MYITKPADYKNEIGLAYNGTFTTYYKRGLLTLHFKTFDLSPYVAVTLDLSSNILAVSDYKLQNVTAGVCARF